MAVATTNDDVLSMLSNAYFAAIHTHTHKIPRQPKHTTAISARIARAVHPHTDYARKYNDVDDFSYREREGE